MNIEFKRRPFLTALVLAMSLALAACGGSKDDAAKADGDQSAEAKDAKDTKDVALDKDGKPVEQIKVPVEVATASRSAVVAAFQGTSNLVAEAEAEVVPKTGGVVLEIMVEEGDKVSAGQVLARLDSDRQRLDRKSVV